MSEIEAEQALWRATLLRAFLDATVGPGDIQKKGSWRDKWRQIRQSARSWLLTNNDSYISVCVMAGLDPDYVRDRAKLVLSGAQPVRYAARGMARRENVPAASQRARRTRENGLAGG